MLGEQTVSYVKLRTFAACQGESLDVLFGEPHVQAEAAIRLCANCPVINECREEGKREAFGLWGGLPEGHPERPLSVRKFVLHNDGEMVPHCRCHNCRENKRQRQEQVAAEQKANRRHAKQEALLRERQAETVLLEVSLEHWIAVKDIVGPSRKAPIAEARREVCRRLRDLGFSFPQIGEVVNRDHASVMWALRARSVQKDAA
jgi:hypothetical protein